MLKASRHILFAALVALPFAAQAQGNLEKTLAQMDQASKSFKSYQADLEWVTYEAVLHANDPAESGTFYCQRANGGTELGIHMTKPGEYIVNFKKDVTDKYVPSTNQDDRFSVAGADGFLALGCGGSGKDLNAAWTIKDFGPETVTLKDGQKVDTEKLDLVPKSSKVLNYATHITVWIDLKRDISVQQVLYEPSGDTKTSFYTHIRYGGNVDTKSYSIPKKAQIIAH